METITRTEFWKMVAKRVNRRFTKPLSFCYIREVHQGIKSCNDELKGIVLREFEAVHKYLDKKNIAVPKRKGTLTLSSQIK